MGESLKAFAIEGHGVAWLVESSIKNELDKKIHVPVGADSLQIKFDIRTYRSIQQNCAQLMPFWECAESISQVVS